MTPPAPVVGPDAELEELKAVVARAKQAFEVRSFWQPLRPRESPHPLTDGASSS